MPDQRHTRGGRLLGVALLLGLMTGEAVAQSDQIRVPAEWEPQEAVWMQWPSRLEAELRPTFADIIREVSHFEPLHLVVPNARARNQAERFLSAAGVETESINWHLMPTDNSWMRDNGPVYLETPAGLELQDWGFDAWGGNWGPEVGYENDDRVPSRLADILDLPGEDLGDYILERGNLEVNGTGIAVLNWDCQDQRNPGMTQGEHEALLRETLGLSQIIWAYGYDPEDGTTGHIDGIARFTNQGTVALASYVTETEVDAARLRADLQAAGFEVVDYPGDPNWLVGNGFVLANDEGYSSFRNELNPILQRLFPGRDIRFIDASALNESGGGIHCVTNDQPALR